MDRRAVRWLFGGTPALTAVPAEAPGLNAPDQSHDVPNLFVTDGACMTSPANQNPSITWTAVPARACAHVVDSMKRREL